MYKVHFETSGSLGILTLANPPLNLLSGELIDDLRDAVNEAKRAPLRHRHRRRRSLRDKVSFLRR
jgi:enoyl-CoA hydratase/carnithine racemase